MVGNVSGNPVQGNPYYGLSAQNMSEYIPPSYPVSGYGYNPYAQYNEPPHRGSLLGSLSKLTLDALIIGGILVGARKFIPALKNYNLTKEIPSGFGNKFKHYFAKSADWVEDNVKCAYNYIVGKLSSKKGNSADNKVKSTKK